MDYKAMPLYQRMIDINKGVKENLKKVGASGSRDVIHESSKVLAGKSSNGNALGVEFDFVINNKNDFKWENQKNRDDVLLVGKILFKTTLESLKKDVLAELMSFHAVQAVRKMLVIVNTNDEIYRENIPDFFVQNYDMLLTFPPHNHVDSSDVCPMCGNSPSVVELWIYDERSNDLKPYGDDSDFY